MHISTLVRLGLTLNGAAGSGDYDDVTVDILKREIESRRIFDTLKIMLGVDVDPGDQVELLEEWGGFIRLDEDKGLSVTRPRSGLTLLVAYILLGIQNRADRKVRGISQRELGRQLACRLSVHQRVGTRKRKSVSWALS